MVGIKALHSKRLKGVALVGSTTMVLLLGLAASVNAVAAPSASTVHASSTHSGSLTATGECPFDYFFDTSGQAYANVTTVGTLTGFSPGKTLYLYDNNDDPGAVPPASVVANARGRLIFDGQDLGLPGVGGWAVYPIENDSRSETGVLQYYISTDPNSTTSRPDHIVYKPPTVLVVNRGCNPWVASGGTTLINDGTDLMSNNDQVYDFGVSAEATGNYCVFDDNAPVWCTKTMGGTDNRIVMQRDGNLVVYNGSTAVWASHTNRHPGALLVLQKDRNLVIYSATGKALWQTGTYVR